MQIKNYKAMITLIIIGAFLMFLFTPAALNAEDDTIRKTIYSFLMVVGMFLLLLGFTKRGERDAYIDSLNGNNPYSKEYIYKQQDSTYVVVDSIYVKEETKN
jgi:hypothetical protein